MIVAAPPVYDPGGPTCLIDDFAVAVPEQWPTVGVDLLGALRRTARERGAAQVVVVCGHLDGPKRTALEHSGLSIASEWWVAPLGLAARMPIPCGKSGFNRSAGSGVAASGSLMGRLVGPSSTEFHMW